MLNLIPLPKKAVELSGSFTLPGSINAEFDVFAQWCIDAFSCREGLTTGGSKWLKLHRNTDIGVEGYKLTVCTDKISVSAATERGIIWALTTVAELERDGAVPCCEIEDSPKMEHRGLSLDCVRHFFPTSEVKKIIEEMSLAKLNVLHWHLSDDQGWCIETKRFPELNEICSDYFTQDEIREIVEFARNRGVEIVPEIDLPGHTTGILAAYPQYSCFEKPVSLAKSGGIYPVILCPGKDSTFAFIEELLCEIIPLFPGSRFHIGGDEAPKSEWKKCPHCRRRMEALGITEVEDLQGYFTCRVADILRKHGRQPICWNETLVAKDIPADAQIQYWTLQHMDAMCRYADRGGKWIYSDMFELYFDYPYSMTSLKKVYESKPHLREKSYTEDPNMIGIECCLWSEHIKDVNRLENLLFPRVYAVAEIGWSGYGDYADFITRLESIIKGRPHKAIDYTARDWWEPKGRARLVEAIAYFTAMISGMDDDVRTQTVENAAPNEDFAQSFITKFFEPEDIPTLQEIMRKH